MPLRQAPLAPGWIAPALGLTGSRDLLEAYSVWGGVPRYWELAADFRSTWRAVESLVLDPLGVLHLEPRRLLMDDMREVVQAASIMALVGRGCRRLSEVASRLGKPATSLTRPLKRLLDLGLVERQTPFGTPAASSKKSIYCIEDPFLAFWLPTSQSRDVSLIPRDPRRNRSADRVLIAGETPAPQQLTTPISKH